MITEKEKSFFMEQGYLVVEGLLDGQFLLKLTAAFDEVWENEKPPINQHKLLKNKIFRELIEYPPILNRHKAIFGKQIQLLQYDLLRQEPKSNFPERSWHRDFVFPGNYPLSVNTILFIDDISEEKGPTRLIPVSHIGTKIPPKDLRNKPIDGEIAVTAKAGTGIFINSAIWHTGGRNNSDGLRRGIYLYYGYWWLKRYENELNLPWQAFEDATEQRLQLLGIKMPDRDLHIYDPDE